MTEKIQSLAEKAKESVPKGILSVNLWIEQYNTIFANLILEECIACCGSQVDKKNIRKAFGLEVEDDVEFSNTSPSWSIESQYDRDYNLPKGIKE